MLILKRRHHSVAVMTLDGQNVPQQNVKMHHLLRVRSTCKGFSSPVNLKFGIYPLDSAYDYDLSASCVSSSSWDVLKCSCES